MLLDKIKTNRSTAYWRERALQHLPGARQKRAASSAGGEDGGFEQAFSSLAYSYLRDKSPKLLDSIVGFQLIDRNEDNTKAVGVFGIQLGDQWIYAPAFFLNGELKGHELLFLPKQNVFVPNKEAWVNYLISRKPHDLGGPSPRDAYQLGGLAPDISRLSRLPFMGKTGCDAWARPFVPVYAAMASGGGAALLEGRGVEIDLRAKVASDVNLAFALLGLARAYPGVKAALDRFYGRDFFRKAAEDMYRRGLTESAVLVPAPAAAPRPRFASMVPLPREKAAAEVVKGDRKLEVYEDASVTRNTEELTDAERERLLKDDVLVKDERDPHGVTTVYDTQVRQTLTNPSGTGLYEVLERPTEFSRMLVVCAPHAQDGQQDFVTVVRLSGGRAWLNADRSKVWARGDEDADREAYREWFDGLDGGSLSAGSTYVAVGGRGQGSCPFTVRESYGDGAYKVDFQTHADTAHRRPRALPSLTSWDAESAEYHGPYGAVVRVNARRGSKLASVRGELYVPNSFKFVKVKDPYELPPVPPVGAAKAQDGGALGADPEAGSKDRPIDPGSIEDVQLLFSEKTASLAVLRQGHEYVVPGPAGPRWLRKSAAVASLVRDHGLREKAARDVLAAADAPGKASFRVKYAYGYPYPNMGPGPDAPPLPPPLLGTEYNGPHAVPAQYSQEEQVPVPSLDPARTDPAVYDPWRNYEYDQGGVSAMQDAGAQGDKEVFDTASLATLTKAVGAQANGETDLPILMKALDKLGRRLFSFYWHQEDLEERYGKHDMPELEDSIRNAFQVLGDVVLFLKQKNVTPVFEGLGDPDIDDAAQN